MHEIVRKQKWLGQIDYVLFDSLIVFKNAVECDKPFKVLLVAGFGQEILQN